MQRIERYGVIALVLFLVTIVAVSFWDDGATMAGGDEPKANERLAGRQNKRQAPKAKNPGTPGLNGRALPATSGGGKRQENRKSQPTGNKRGTLAGRQASNVKFEKVQGTVANRQAEKPQTKPVVFPDSLTEPDPRTQPKNQAAKTQRATQNYDTIQERSRALALRREREAAAREAASQAKKNDPVKAAGAAARTYTVQPGDTLSEISFKTLGTSKRWREIQALNGNLDPSQLSVDMVLRLPSGATGTGTGAVAVREAAAATSTSSASRGTYIVRKGDVLSQIAQDQLGGASRWREIAQLNPTIDPNRLMEGAELRMPGSAAPALASLTTTPRPTRKKNRVR